MNDEDIILEELLEVAIGKKTVKSTIKLKNINSNKITTLQKTLSETENKKVSFALLLQVNLINKKYNEFIFDNNETINYSRDLIKRVSKNNFKGKTEVLKKLSNLYKSNETKWLKKYVDLNKILQIMCETNKNLCPVCQGHIEVSNENDHFLPSSVFPTLSISRQNLFPVCSTCNSAGYKGDSIPSFPILTPILSDNTPASDYFRFLPVQKHSQKNFNSLKEELTKLELKGIDESILCDVLPINEVHPYSKKQVNNIIELYKLKKLYNNKKVLKIPINEYGKIINKIKGMAIYGDIREIEGKLDNMATELVNDINNGNSDSRYIKFRIAMLNHLHTSMKQILLYSLYSYKK